MAPALNAAHEALCGRRQRRLAASYGVGSLHAGLAKHAGNLGSVRPGVTTDDAAEAQRRRERGAKALAERLALKAKKNASPRAMDAATAASAPPSASGSVSVSAGVATTTLGEETAEAV